MDEHLRGIVYPFLRWSFLILTGTILCSYLLDFSRIGEMILAYFLSFIFVASNYWVVLNFRKQTHKVFYRRFLIILAVRFIFVLGTLILVMKLTKLHEIYFTVSFIISYILHSVIEIILINEILQTDN